jgi:outer membrane murein-binding lipoprotein Lpp
MVTIRQTCRAAAALCLVGALARGQPEADPRRQVDRLATQVRDLTAQLAESQRHVERLQAERDELLARLRSADQTIAALRRGGGGGAAPARAPIPEDPSASPASLLAELHRRYQREVASLPTADAGDAPGRAQHRRDTQRWCQQTARQLRAKAAWLVRLAGPRPGDAPEHVSVLVTVLDEASGLPIGDPFRSEIPQRIAQRIDRERRARRPDDAPWRATGLLIADPRFNPDRVEPGPYNTPPFVGLYVEFGFQIDWHSLTPADAPTATGEPGKGG